MEGIRLLTRLYSTGYLFRKAALLLDAIKFHESIFALPFAYAGMILAADGLPTWSPFIWITVAMISARTVGMTANRVIDRSIDALNPRTSERHLPKGTLSAIDLKLLGLLSTGIFFLASAQLNKLAVILAPGVIAILIIYPYTKRYTWAAAIVLGCTLAIAPSAAWIAVTGNLTWEPVLLSLAVACWATSFDIIYHTQDVEFHSHEGLHSVAQRFGISRAFSVAKILDVWATACLISLGIWMELNWIYFLGCGAAGCLLAYRYTKISPSDLTRLGIAFLRVNSYVSTTMFAAILLAVLI